MIQDWKTLSEMTGFWPDVDMSDQYALILSLQQTGTYLVKVHVWTDWDMEDNLFEAWARTYEIGNHGFSLPSTSLENDWSFV